MRLSKNRYREKLERKGLTQGTIQSYVNALEKYELWLRTKKIKENERDNTIAFTYLKFLKKKYSNNNTLYGFIYPIKLYYRLFRKDNLFEYIHFKRKEERIKDNSFSMNELEEIYDNFPQNTITEIRDKVLLSLYIFQGIRTKEIKTIETKDLDRSGYSIVLKGDTKTNKRKIGLDVKQIILLNDYLTLYRNKLLNNKKTDILILTSKKANCIESIVYQLSKKLRKEVYGFENINQIRTSVIKHWLNLYDLRKVQYLCGHRYISSTEKFIVHDIKELSKDIEKYFPLH